MDYDLKGVKRTCSW